MQHALQRGRRVHTGRAGVPDRLTAWTVRAARCSAAAAADAAQASSRPRLLAGPTQLTVQVEQFDHSGNTVTVSTGLWAPVHDGAELPA